MKSIFGVFLIILMTSLHVMAYDQLTLNGFSIDANGAITFTGATNTGALTNTGDVTNTGALTNTGAVTLTGAVTHDGNWVEVPSCTSTVTRTFGVAVSTFVQIAITDRYMVVGTTMPKHQTSTAIGHVITMATQTWTQTISTSAYSVGTIVTIFNSTGTIVLTDWDTNNVTTSVNANTGLDLGAATRSLGIRDNITLILLYLDDKILWRELGFVDN